MIHASKRHLAEVDESYGEHFLFALCVSALMLRAGLACAIHALVPALCPRTASRCFARLQARFDARRTAAAVPPLDSDTSQNRARPLPSAHQPVLSG